MANYTFQTTLLSAEKTGNPNLIGTVITASGVTITSLSTIDVGLAFIPQSSLIAISTATLTALASASLSTATLTALGVTALSSLPALTASVLNVGGSVFSINTAYAGESFGIVKVPADNLLSFGVFTNLAYSVLSGTPGTTTIALSNVTATREVSTSDSRRKRHLGY